MKRRAFVPIMQVYCWVAVAAILAVGSQWPLVGDSVLMHYVVWLTRHGFAPYRDIAEMNLPLTYMSEQGAMAIFGAGDAGWRLYDGTVCVLLVLACWRLLLRDRGPAGLLAGTVFIAVHLQDGIHMAGQRDLLVTLLQAGAGLALVADIRPRQDGAAADHHHGSRRGNLCCVFAGALGMAAATIKPTAVLFVAAAIAWRLVHARSHRVQHFFAAVAGALVPLLACLLYLRHFGAVGAFFADVRGLIAYHASIERRSIGFLLAHAWSPVLPLLVATAVALSLNRGRAAWPGADPPPTDPSRADWSPTDTIAVIGVVTGLLSYLLQGKGFPYQRYPMLLWLLLLCASRVEAAVQASRARTPVQRVGPMQRVGIMQRVGLALPLITAVVLVLLFIAHSMRFSHVDPYADLRADLRSRGAGRLDRQVQCLDTAGPCIGAMLKEHLTESTGFLYDCYLLDGSKPVVEQQRQMFAREWQAHPPALVVVTDSNCFTGPRQFDKYNDWPWMQQQLTGYRVTLERHPKHPLQLWSRAEQPYAYRILERR